VLISGAAVQLTFGLRNYLMDYFDVIHVMRKEYVLNSDKETYYGHVSRNGIHISWNRFREGYGDYTDSVNVGLHEMAHALQFDVYLGLEDHHDRGFKDRLSDFSEEGRPVFRAMRKGMSHLLDDYAMTNFDEFWAVSVETFFENPEEFREKLPALYQEMSVLLNQDPLYPGNVIDPGIG
jgi:Mlc titration factor MtfA (ptsG expression regulator)